MQVFLLAPGFLTLSAMLWVLVVVTADGRLVVVSPGCTYGKPLLCWVENTGWPDTGLLTSTLRLYGTDGEGMSAKGTP